MLVKDVKQTWALYEYANAIHNLAYFVYRKKRITPDPYLL